MKYGVIDRNVGDGFLVDGPFETAIEAEIAVETLQFGRPRPDRFEIVRWFE